jgi:hypothetical protein
MGLTILSNHFVFVRKWRSMQPGSWSNVNQTPLKWRGGISHHYHQKLHPLKLSHCAFQLGGCLDPNGEWHLNPTNIYCFLEKKIILMTICPSLNWDGRVGMQPTTSFLMLLFDMGDVILLNEIILHHGLPHVDPCSPNCLEFVVHLFHRVPQAQLGPNVVLKNLKHLGNI